MDFRQAFAISLVNTVQDFYTQGYRRFHLFMTSEGGDVRAAMFAYETLKAMPITLSATAVGPIDSAAVHLYCAASERYAAPRVTFMFHPMYNQRNISTRSTSSIDVMNAAYKGWSDDVFSACFGGMPKEWDIDREDYRAEFGEARKIGLVNADGDVYATLGDVARAWSGVFFGVVEITGR